MTFKLQAQAGSCRRSMWCGAAEHSGMPSPSEQDDWGACTFFGRALKAADITSVRPGSARRGIAQPRQNKGAASLTKAPLAFRKIGEAVNRQGMLTITGSNVHLGTEMPVALSLSFA